MFKPGDRVRRVRDFRQTRHTFNSSTIYTVEKAEYGRLILAGVPGEYIANKFELVRPRRNLPDWF